MIECDSSEIDETMTLTVQSGQKNIRLDLFLKDSFHGLSRSYFQNLINDGQILVNKKKAKKSYVTEVDDEIEVKFVINDELTLLPEKIPLDILYEDEYFVVINKKAGIVVHPAFGNWSGTLVNALLYHCQTMEKDASCRPGIVHRLDKDTTGVLVAAKTQESQRKLADLFAARQVEKSYLALCLGSPKSVLTIQAPLGRHPIFRKKMAVMEASGKEAYTELHPVQRGKNVSLVRLFIKTGRTHQIRVHLAHIGCPVLGDSIYGRQRDNESYKAKRQMLHAERIAFMHPYTNKLLDITAPFPSDMEEHVKLLVR